VLIVASAQSPPRRALSLLLQSFSAVQTLRPLTSLLVQSSLPLKRLPVVRLVLMMMLRAVVSMAAAEGAAAGGAQGRLRLHWRNDVHSSRRNW
jgi:hypothetical protein